MAGGTQPKLRVHGERSHSLLHDVSSYPEGANFGKLTSICRNGPSEFYVTGLLKDWSIVKEASNIKVPTLLLNGVHDEAADSTVIPFFKAIPKVKWYTFSESSHTPHWEEREKYMRVVSDFLKA